MPDPRYEPPTRDEEVIVCRHTGARLVVDRPGCSGYRKDAHRPLDREADIILTRHRIDDLGQKVREAPNEVVAEAARRQLGFARDHMAALMADARHPMLGRDMVGRPAGVADAEAA